MDRSVTPENIHSKYAEGQEVDVRVLEVNTVNNKMSLSMLEVQEDFGECRRLACCKKSHPPPVSTERSILAMYFIRN